MAALAVAVLIPASITDPATPGSPPASSPEGPLREPWYQPVLTLGAPGATGQLPELDPIPPVDPVPARPDVAGQPAPPVRPVSSARITGKSGIPGIVLQAYQRAERATSDRDPGCGLGWPALAAIGRIESGHARGGQVDSAGTTVHPILGPQLSGGPGVAAIPDTDGGRLDSDPVWDRAVGPMQFIPGTWRKYAWPGANPHNVFDAALAAARYLCAGGGDLRDRERLAAAVFRYNHSAAYVDTVLSWADAYAHGVTPMAAVPVPPAPPTPTPAASAPATTTEPETSPTPTPSSVPLSTPPSDPPPTSSTVEPTPSGPGPDTDDQDPPTTGSSETTTSEAVPTSSERNPEVEETNRGPSGAPAARVPSRQTITSGSPWTQPR